MEYTVKILSIKPVTHDVKQFRTEKPEGYHFVPGQATEVSINKAGWEEERRPFTFTCLNDEGYLEFVIKGYKDHDGATNQLHLLEPGDELIVRDVWGAINYQGEGYFIAGGAGITPFIAILRQLKNSNKLGNNKLFFCNKTKEDIILKEELEDMLGDNVEFVLTRDNAPGYEKGRIDGAYLDRHVKDFSRYFYVCGPDKMVSDLNATLMEHGVLPDEVVFEK